MSPLDRVGSEPIGIRYIYGMYYLHNFSSRKGLIRGDRAFFVNNYA